MTNIAKMIALILLAMLPVVVGSVQLAHYIVWLFDLGYTSNFWDIVDSSVALLIPSFFVSILEHFCSWYRLTIVGTIYLNASCFISDYFPSILSYNITNIVAAFIIVIGICGCLVHFGYQIKDFIRYIYARQHKH